MGLEEDIKNKAKTIFGEEFTVTDVSYVPTLDDPKLTFGNTGLRFTGSVLFIDIRGSTELLNEHKRPTVAKIHMAFFHTIVKIANSLKGEVRSFNGDSALIFFEGNYKETLSTATKCGMQIKYCLGVEDSPVRQLLRGYADLDFGIGIDHGEILCTKVGIGGQQNRDIFWISNSVNRSTRLGDDGEAPNHVYISKYVYDNLLDWAKFGTKKNMSGEDVSVDMWDSSTFQYNGTWETRYSTTWYWRL